MGKIKALLKNIKIVSTCCLCLQKQIPEEIQTSIKELLVDDRNIYEIKGFINKNYPNNKVSLRLIRQLSKKFIEID